MNRFKLKHSDMPLRVRELPFLPSKLPSSFSLEDSLFHKILLALDRLQLVPHVMLLSLIAFLAFALAGWLGSVPALVLALAQLSDWLLLMALPRLRVSFGPVQTQWLTLAALRLLVALIFGGLRYGVSSMDAVAIAAQAIGVLLVFRGYYVEPRSLKLSRIKLAVPSLQAGSELRLLHVADAHLERHGVREDQLLELARSARPDVILFTGDLLNLSYVDDPVAQAQAHELWRRLSEIAPIYAVSGSGPVDPPSVITNILEDLPVVWLRDEVRTVCLQGHSLQVIGVTCTHNPINDGETLRCVLKNFEPSSQLLSHSLRGLAPELGSGAGDERERFPFTILLYHAPDLAPQAAASGLIDLQLSGHTHGGQVRLPWFGALVTSSHYHKKLEMGLYRLQDMLLFVNRGIGLEGKGAPRVRFNCRPEIMLLEMRGER